MRASAAVGFDPLLALIELLRADHLALDPHCSELPLQAKAKAARFVDRVERRAGMLLPQFFGPDQEGLFREALRRLGIAPAFLHDHDVKCLVHIDSQLDRGRAAIKLVAGSLE